MPKHFDPIDNGAFAEEKKYRWDEKRRQNLEKARKARWINKTPKQTVIIPKKFREIRKQVMERLNWGDINGALQIGAPAVLSKMFDLAVSGIDTKVSRDCARDWAYMAGYKPMERQASVHMDLNRMSGKELTVLIASELKRLPAGDREAILRRVKEMEIKGDKSDPPK